MRRLGGAHLLHYEMADPALVQSSCFSFVSSRQSRSDWAALLVGFIIPWCVGLEGTLDGLMPMAQAGAPCPGTSPFLAEFLGTTLRVPSGDVVVANVRLAHAVLPIPSKATSDWGYGVGAPVIGPIIGGVGAWFYVALWTA